MTHGREQAGSTESPEVYGSFRERPARDYELGAGLRLLREVSVVLGALPVVLIAWHAMNGPDRVPVHFGFDGTVNRDGSPWELFWTALLVWGTCVLGMAILSRHPRLFNFPQVLTSENVQRLYRLGETSLIWLAFAAALMVWGIAGSLGYPTFWLLWVGLGVMTVAVVLLVWRSATT
ncbi:DUF1648 domain-containing protein [Nesterenkonia sp. HG001]|uniref:DUF1648 domain-containing protein n=1 Tax=Nesterenkonia sp. HG001 TaxID=2983207 RepID=UPI002AC772FA|nr:DUF1648 domain-containing protein [Nesterenkonia sp. HG001]MDZ5077627.1 DUF1648 domain-containing protein [Nesterenkonia sp. HG001]